MMHSGKWPAFARIVVSIAMVASLGVSLQSVGAQTPQPAQRSLTVRAATPVGRTSAGQPITLSVGLEPQSTPALDAFLSALYTPGAPEYHQYLTPQQFTGRFFDPASRVQVVSYLRGKGLSVTDPGIGSVLTATASAGQVEQAFNVTLTNYRDATGRVFYANDRTPAIDATVASLITGVAGLNTQSRPQPRFVRDPRTAAPMTPSPRAAVGCAAAVAASGASGPYTPNEFAAAYNFTPLYTAGFHGEGQTIALVEYDDYVDGNVSTFQSCFGTSVSVERVPLRGGITTIGSGQGEVELDIDVIAGLAPHLSHLLVFEDGAGNLAATFQSIANDNRAKVVSTSWGDCETNFTPDQRAAENTVFMQLAAQGMSVFNAYGDYGSECGYPSGDKAIVADELGSNPYITDVGGTSLLLNANNTIQSEVVWNNDTVAQGSRAIAGGGGISAFYARPTYQTGPGTTNAYSNGHREAPDITIDGDPSTGYDVYTGDSGSVGSWGSVGGTSAGAPLYAAAFALIDQKLAARGISLVGFANPTLYALWREQAGTFVRDITVGDNCIDPSCGTPDSGTGTYPATTGFDMASGIGSLNIAAFSDRFITPASVPTAKPTATVKGSPHAQPVAKATATATAASRPNPQPTRH